MDQLAVQRTTILDGVKITRIGITRLLTVSAMYIFFAADLANKVLIYYKVDYSRISVIFRSLYEMIFFAIILLFPNTQRWSFLALLLISFASFEVGQIVFGSNVIGFSVSYIENIAFFNKYFFVFVIYYGIYKLQEHPLELGKAIRVMEKLFLLNACITLIGVVFGIQMFETYVLQPYRFGYSGILWVQNEATVMCFLAISYFYYKHFILGQKSKQFWIVLLASLFLGTKAIYLFMAMLLLFHFIMNSSLKVKLIVLFFAVVVYFVLAWFLQTDTAIKLLAYFITKADRMGVWYMLFSGRVQYLDLIGEEIIKFWSPINYVVGGEDPIKFMVEMDFIDLYLFLGLVGFITYFILSFTTIFRFNLKRPFNLFFVLAYMSIAFVAGHFFSSVINAVYVVLVCMFFHVTSKRAPSLNEENIAHQ